MNLNIFFSNSLDIHYEQLKTELFSRGTLPFRRRLVVVYGPAMQSWLMLKMAQDPELGIATGIEFIYLNHAFEFLLKMTDPKESIHFPSTLELALGIEKELRDILKNFDSLDYQAQQDWYFLLSYLKIDRSVSRSKISTKMEKRIIGLSKHMAALFRDYGRYGNPLIEQWGKKSCDWQGHLWNALFNSTGMWDNESISLKNQIEKFDENCEVHFFSISFISRCEFDFLNRLSKKTPIHYYLISPCAVFWSDIRSDKENTRLYSFWNQKKGTSSSQIVELEEYLRDRNPLLANFGRLGREMATQIELSEARVSAQYLIPSSVGAIDENIYYHEDIVVKDSNSSLSLLQAVQADMLLLRNPVGEEISDLENDDSIQLHQAPTRRREIQILYNNLLRIIEKHPDIHPSDIIVMAPQIVEYVPYIRALFGSSTSQLDCQILDLGLQNHNEIVQGFLQLVSLCDGRWDVADLLQLFENRAFQRCHKINTSDYFAIQNWIKKAGIYWGDDQAHREDLLRRNHCQNGMTEKTAVGTWDFGLSRIMLGLTTILEEEAEGELSLEMLPCENIDFSQVELLNKWISLLHSLRDDLTPLHDGTKMTMEDWSKYLTCLLESYFQPDFEVAESIQDYEEIKSQFEILCRSTNAFFEALYPFYSVKTHLEDLLEHKGITFRENYLQSVRFCSLMPLRSIPAKVIAILGMEEGTFPRQNQYSSLNLMLSQNECDYCPLPADYDRYLFLEAIHSAQYYLLLSYQGYSSKDQKELQPCLVVTELFSYLNNHYTLQGQGVMERCVYKHPFDSFDKKYFYPNTSLSNYSLTDYQAAQTCENPVKEPLHSFLSHFVPNENAPSEDQEIKVIDIKNLTALAKNPIKFHLNRSLEIYLEGAEDRELKNEEDLTLSPLTKYQMKESPFKETTESILNRAEKAGQMPFGMFKEVASQKFREEMDSLETGLQKHQIKKEEIFQIEFNQNCKQPVQIKADHWMLPAVEVDYKGGKRIIIGKLPFVSNQGLISLKNSHIQEIWKVWPQYLLYQSAAEHFPTLLKQQIIPLEAANPKKYVINDPTSYLKSFIDYYERSHSEISPLMPEWISSISQQDAASLRKEMEKSFIGFQKEVQWTLNKNSLPDAEKIIQDWKPHLDLLADCLFKEDK
jgi:exodeoxyribonuclease V gamma subunit